MNIVITVHPRRADAFRVTLSAASEESTATLEAERMGYEQEIGLACSYLSGLDGKTVKMGSSATVIDLAIVIGKYHEGDIEVTAGRIPPTLLSDPMGDEDQDDAESDA